MTNVGVGGSRPKITYDVPDAIDLTGQTDCSHGLELWLSNLPAGTSVEFPADARIRCESGVNIVAAKGLDILRLPIFANSDGTDATPSPNADAHKWPRHRALLRLLDCEDTFVRDARIEGPHAFTSVWDDDAWVPELEAQHAIEVHGGRNNQILGGSGGNVFGDLLYVGGRAKGTIACGGRWEGAGRQGIAICNADDTVIHDWRGRRIRRSAIDIEPAVTSWAVRGVHIEATQIHDVRLSWLANLGTGTIEDITLLGNTADHLNVISRPKPGQRRSNYHLAVNAACGQWSHGGGAPMMVFESIDGLAVTGNYAEYKAVHGDPADAIAVDARDCTDVTIEDNIFPITKFRSREYTGHEARIRIGA